MRLRPRVPIALAVAAGATVHVYSLGPGVAPGSLSLAAHPVSWRDGSSTRTATLR